MPRIKMAGFGVSLDGFAAGTEQSLEHPLGKRGPELFQWFFPTRTFREMRGESGGDTGPDDAFAQRAMAGFGAFILGRNMFGPIRGEWPDEQWKGWWGDNPPYHAPVFVLTHHARASVEMAGGTIFHFVTHGIEAALEQAKDAAGGRDVKIGGGVSTVRQYLQAGLIDEIHFAIAPVALGRGEAMFTGIDLQSQSVAQRPAPHLDGRCVIGKSRALGDTAGQASGETHNGGDRDLLSQHRADCQLEAVPGARNAQPRPGLHQRGQRRIFSEMGGDSYRISRQVEHASQPRDDGRQCRELRESHRRAERVPVGGLDRDRSLHVIQLHGPRVKVGSDTLDAGNGAPAEKRQHGRPVVRRMIAQQKADLAMSPCQDLQAARAPQIAGLYLDFNRDKG
jgi:dihydrofolate reductase